MQKGRTALHVAAAEGRAECVKVLLAGGAAVNQEIVVRFSYCLCLVAYVFY